MAYQTSKILQEHSTPRSIGRLMDADFFGGAAEVSRRRMAPHLCANSAARPEAEELLNGATSQSLAYTGSQANDPMVDEDSGPSVRARRGRLVPSLFRADRTAPA